MQFEKKNEKENVESRIQDPQILVWGPPAIHGTKLSWTKALPKSPNHNFKHFMFSSKLSIIFY